MTRSNWTTIQTVTGNQSKAVVDFSGLSGTGRTCASSAPRPARARTITRSTTQCVRHAGRADSLGPAGSLSARCRAATTGSSETATPALPERPRPRNKPGRQFDHDHDDATDRRDHDDAARQRVHDLDDATDQRGSLVPARCQGPPSGVARSTQHVSLLSRPRVLPGRDLVSSEDRGRVNYADWAGEDGLVTLW